MCEAKVIPLRLPLAEADVMNLHVGDAVRLSGDLLTGRDAAHRWLVDTFIHPRQPVTAEGKALEEQISDVLRGGAIYHCGPVVVKREDGSYRFVAAGPTTSMREEAYQADVMHHFGVKAIIGKGGMGKSTLQACQQAGAVYLHATGGAGAIMAACVKKVLGVYQMNFGVPEAMWWIRVEQMPLIVTMDAHGMSLHETVLQKSKGLVQSILEQSIFLEK